MVPGVFVERAIAVVGGDVAIVRVGEVADGGRTFGDLVHLVVAAAIAIDMGGDGAAHIHDLVGPVADIVMIEDEVAPGAVGILQAAGGGVPEGLVVGRGDVVPDVGEVEIIGAGVGAPDSTLRGILRRADGALNLK